MEAGVDQWSALSHQAAPFGRVSHSETTTFTPPLVGSSFHTAYRRPNVGLPEALSMISIGLPWVAAMKLSDSSTVSLLAFESTPGAASAVVPASRLGAYTTTRAAPARRTRPVASSTQRNRSR